MWTKKVDIEHTELDDLLLYIHERQEEAEVTESLKANNVSRKDRKQKKLENYWWSVYQKLRREEVTVMMIFDVNFAEEI